MTVRISNTIHMHCLRTFAVISAILVLPIHGGMTQEVAENSLPDEKTTSDDVANTTADKAQDTTDDPAPVSEDTSAPIQDDTTGHAPDNSDAAPEPPAEVPLSENPDTAHPSQTVTAETPEPAPEPSLPAITDSLPTPAPEPAAPATQPPTAMTDVPRSPEEQSPLTQSPLAGKLLITEIVVGASGSGGSKKEYVELFNASTDSVDLRDVALSRFTKTSTTRQKLVKRGALDDVLAPGAYFVIAHNDFGAIGTNGVNAHYSSSHSIANDSTITLTDAENRDIDSVRFGNFAPEMHPAPNPKPGEGLERIKRNGAYVDTDNSKNDFDAIACPQPGMFVPPNAVAPITLSEIYPRPCTATDDDCAQTEEFIELHNAGNDAVSLERWTIRDASERGVYTFTAADTIPPHGYRALTKDAYKFALNDHRDTVTLFNPLCAPVARIAYTDARARQSYNAGDAAWYWAQPTPNAPNAPDPATRTFAPLRITEILPSTADDERASEYIELYNPTDDTVPLANWQLRDASRRGSYVFPASATIAPRAFFVIHRATFTFALNNTADTVSLLTPGDAIMSTVSYAGARKGLSYNFDDGAASWRWSKYQTPGQPNRFNTLPRITKKSIPTVGYNNMFTPFAIAAKDHDREKLTIRWEFGDGRRSYLWQTRHKYLKNGTYTGVARVRDDSEEVVIPFTITIKNYPRRRVAITEILPNPDGRDTGAEYLALTNTDTKHVDLFGWGIATGTTKKRLVNHPIRAHVILKKSDTLRITREHAAITLPNTTGVVELRAPNGKVVDSVSYAAEKRSIPEDALYVRAKDGWQWQTTLSDARRFAAAAIAAAAAENENARREARIAQNAIHRLIHTEPPDAAAPVMRDVPAAWRGVERLCRDINAALTALTQRMTTPTRASRMASAFPRDTRTPRGADPCANPAYIAPPHTTFTFCVP